MKGWIALQFGKFVMRLIQWGISWVKTQTPEQAQQARRISKTKILNAKAKALETATDADDIAPIGAYNYMGFKTMKQAQHKLAEAFEVEAGDGGPLPIGEINPFTLEKIIRQAIHILDEEE